MISQRHFQNSKYDNSLFYKWNNCHLTLILVYVDDIIITCSSSPMNQQVIHGMHRTFGLKDLREFHYFLGIKVNKFASGIYLSQAKYIVDILVKDGVTNCSLVPTHMSISH